MAGPQGYLASGTRVEFGLGLGFVAGVGTDVHGNAEVYALAECLEVVVPFGSYPWALQPHHKDCAEVVVPEERLLVVIDGGVGEAALCKRGAVIEG